jgi:hypothetical protein
MTRGRLCLGTLHLKSASFGYEPMFLEPPGQGRCSPGADPRPDGTQRLITTWFPTRPVVRLRGFGPGAGFRVARNDVPGGGLPGSKAPTCQAARRRTARSHAPRSDAERPKLPRRNTTTRRRKDPGSPKAAIPDIGGPDATSIRMQGHSRRSAFGRTSGGTRFPLRPHGRCGPVRKLAGITAVGRQGNGVQRPSSGMGTGASGAGSDAGPISVSGRSPDPPPEGEDFRVHLRATQ